MERIKLEAYAVALKEVQKRKEEDSLLSFKPTPKQIPFIKSVLKREARENWFVCANRAGKTFAGAYIGSYLARFGFEDPPTIYCGDGIEVRDRATSGWVVGLDFPMLRDTVQPYYFDNGFGAGAKAFIPKEEIAEFRSGDQILKLKNGSILGFKSAESGRSKFYGAAKDWIHFDEEPPKPVFDECTIRVGSKKLTLFGTCTLLPPEGAKGGVSWVFNEILVPYMAGQSKDVAAFNSSIYDNPHIPRDEIEKLESKFPLHSDIGKIRLLGHWLPGLSGARAYTNFNRNLHVEDTTPYWSDRSPLLWSWDFNVSPMCSVVSQKVGGLFVVHREFILEEANIYDMVDAFRDVYGSHRAELWIFGDATGKARSPHTNKTSYDLISQKMIDYPSPIKMRVPEINPSVTSRINAMQTALKGVDGEIGTIINPDCHELILDMQGVLLDNNGKIKKTSDRNNTYFRRTHISDALGYMVTQMSPVESTINTGRRISIPTPKVGFTRR